MYSRYESFIGYTWWIFFSLSVVYLFILLMMFFDERKFLHWMKFTLSIVSLTALRQSALGPLSAFSSQALGCCVLTCRSLAYPSCRPLLLCWLAIDSLRWGLKSYSSLDKQNCPLFLTHAFLCSHGSCRLELLDCWGLPACQQPPVLLPWCILHFTFQSEPHPGLLHRAKMIHSSLSSLSWLQLHPSPKCFGRWSLTLPLVPSGQGNNSPDLHSPGLCYKLSFHLKTKT